MDYLAIHFSGHAIVQMFKRNIKVDDVKQAVKGGKVIKSYPHDKPYPSF
jgi:hypothetical protein